MNSRLKLVFSAVGVFISVFIYGILQEKLMRTKYSSSQNKDDIHGEQFALQNHFSALLGLQSLFATIGAHSESNASDSLEDPPLNHTLFAFFLQN